MPMPKILKFLTTSFPVVILISSNAWATTKGHYLGLDAAWYQATSTTHYSSNSGNVPSKAKNTNGVGLGVNYSYAINSNSEGFFFAPRIFFDYIKAKDSYHFDAATINGHPYSAYDFSYKVDYVYGLQFDIGYDFTDSFAAYVAPGFAVTRYKEFSTHGNKNTNEVNEALSAGFKFYPSRKIGLKLEYSYYPNTEVLGGCSFLLGVFGPDRCSSYSGAQLVKLGTVINF